MTYAITSIKLDKEGQGKFEQTPSLWYKNNTLEDCTIDMVNITLKKSNDANPVEIKLDTNTPSPWWSWGPAITASAHCSITGDEGKYQINFVQPLNGIVPGVYDYIITNDAKSKASIWWGARLFDGYLTGLAYLMAGNLGLPLSTNIPPLTFGTLGYVSEETSSMVGDPSFKLPFFFFLQKNGGIRNNLGEPNAADFNSKDATKSTFSRPATEGLFVVKALSSLILADLGNNKSGNLLLDSASLQYALNPNDDFNRADGGPLNLTGGYKKLFDWQRLYGISPPSDLTLNYNTAVPWREAYAAFADDVGSLGTAPATILEQYACSVPHRKSLLTIILLVMVADYVLLKAWWAIFKIIADCFVPTELAEVHCEEGYPTNGKVDSFQHIELRPQSYDPAGSTESLIEGREGVRHSRGPLDNI